MKVHLWSWTSVGPNLGTQPGQGLFPQASLAESDACSCSPWGRAPPGSADLHSGQAELAGLRAGQLAPELGEEAPEIWRPRIEGLLGETGPSQFHSWPLGMG